MLLVSPRGMLFFLKVLHFRNKLHKHEIRNHVLELVNNNASWHQQQRNVIILLTQSMRLCFIPNSISHWPLENQRCPGVKRQTQIQTADLDNLLHPLKSQLFQEWVLVIYDPISYFQKAFLYQFHFLSPSLYLVQVIHKSIRKERHL